MLDRVGLEVSEFSASKAFYEAALAPLRDPPADGNNVEAVCHRG